MIGTITLERQQVTSKNCQDYKRTINIEVGLEPYLVDLLHDLSPEKAWGERQIAARRIGQLRDARAVPGLLAALKSDSFWMVRCAIIQALEMIQDPSAVPDLEDTALVDGFQVVRSYARKAAERLASCRC